MEYNIRKVILKQDLKLLFNMMNNELYGLETINSVQEFEEWIIEKLQFYYQEFYVVTNTSGESTGFIYLYDNRINDRHCKMYSYINEKIINEQVRSNILKEYVDGIFKEYPIRKIFIEETANNQEKLKDYFSIGAKEECILKDYKYANGKYYDLKILSITR